MIGKFKIPGVEKVVFTDTKNKEHTIKSIDWVAYHVRSNEIVQANVDGKIYSVKENGDIVLTVWCKENEDENA